mmetsp:Transcript_39348/g.81709  ORF Transcript_39348/g.81709 Transcript_39348/m.81709 type:complete len:225 (+) Transcript_39348:611-1285(+)
MFVIRVATLWCWIVRRLGLEIQRLVFVPGIMTAALFSIGLVTASIGDHASVWLTWANLREGHGSVGKSVSTRVHMRRDIRLLGHPLLGPHRGHHLRLGMGVSVRQLVLIKFSLDIRSILRILGGSADQRSNRMHAGDTLLRENFRRLLHIHRVVVARIFVIAVIGERETCVTLTRPVSILLSRSVASVRVLPPGFSWTGQVAGVSKVGAVVIRRVFLFVVCITI